MSDKDTGCKMVRPAVRLGFDHPRLGLLTCDEVRMMRQVPIGYAEAEWTQERLDNIRKSLAKHAGGTKDP